MLLSQSARYALRAAIYLAKRDGEWHLSHEIAASLGVPAQYLAKILKDLTRHGVLTSTRGRGGGFRLAHPAGQIDLLRVVQAIDVQRFDKHCVLGLPDCSDERPCVLHESWSHLRDEILRMLKDTYLSDLSRGHPLRA